MQLANLISTFIKCFRAGISLNSNPPTLHTAYNYCALLSAYCTFLYFVYLKERFFKDHQLNMTYLQDNNFKEKRDLCIVNGSNNLPKPFAKGKFSVVGLLRVIPDGKIEQFNHFKVFFDCMDYYFYFILQLLVYLCLFLLWFSSDHFCNLTTYEPCSYAVV